MLTIGFLFVCYVSVFIIIVLLCLLLLCMLFLIFMFLNTISRQRTEQVLAELDISAIEEYIIIIIIIIEGERKPSFEDQCDFIAVRGRVANNVFGQDLSTPLCNNHIFTTKGRKYDRQRVLTMATGGEVQHSISTPTVCCIYCNGSLTLWNCEKLKSANYNEIRRFMREKRLGDNCLQYGHISGRCSRNKYCRQKDCTLASKHHELVQHTPKTRSDVKLATTCHAMVPQTRKSVS